MLALLYLRVGQNPVFIINTALSLVTSGWDLDVHVVPKHLYQPMTKTTQHTPEYRSNQPYENTSVGEQSLSSENQT